MFRSLRHARFCACIRMPQLVLIPLALVLAVLSGLAVALATAAPALAAPPTQTPPLENSVFPALVQVALIVLVTEGIKSLARALGGANADGTPKIDLSGKAAAYAYIAVGLAVYLIQMYLLPALPAGAADALTNVLGVLATLLAGSGLFSMTAAFRVPQK